MPIPDYQSIMLPLLEFYSDKKEHSIRETVDDISKFFDLTNEEKERLLPCGKETTISNRVRWSKWYLENANLLESTDRGFFRITNRGVDVLKEQPQSINIKYLQRFPEFVEFTKRVRLRKGRIESKGDEKILEKYTPLELLELNYNRIKDRLADELLTRVKNCDPVYFQRIVIDLLLKMGYGRSHEDAGQIVGGAGDQGIDGIISQDKLGLDSIYIQAKRWKDQVPSSTVREFAGALQGKKANKGVIITTSHFSPSAKDFAEKIGAKIVLIDGEELVDLMIRHNVGVSRSSVYEIKTIDTDYFSEE